ncbi:MAG: hypothetical protein QXN16_04350 [Candidatus Micrarchaeaceae archaeon]
MFGWLRKHKNKQLPAVVSTQTTQIDNSTGDIILDSYYALLEKAKKNEDLDKIVQYANAIQERERFLERSARGRKASYSRRNITRREEEEEGEEEEQKETQNWENIDINNLSSHAEEIADAIVEMLSSANILPGFVIKQAKPLILKIINEHPDAIKNLLEKLKDLLPKNNNVIPNTVAIANNIEFDPYHPEKYFKTGDF